MLNQSLTSIKEKTWLHFLNRYIHTHFDQYYIQFAKQSFLFEADRMIDKKEDLFWILKNITRPTRVKELLLGGALLNEKNIRNNKIDAPIKIIRKNTLKQTVFLYEFYNHLFFFKRFKTYF